MCCSHHPIALDLASGESKFFRAMAVWCSHYPIALVLALEASVMHVPRLARTEAEVTNMRVLS